MIETVLFDCDGVIVDSMKIHAAAWCELFAKYGVTIQPEDVYREEGRHIDDFVTLMLSRNGHPAKKLSAHMLAQEKENSVIAGKNIPLFPEIPALMTDLHNRKITTGLVTGSNLRLVEAVVPENVLCYFNTIVTADEIKNGKPEPEPYLRAAEKLNVQPESCLVVENAPLGIRSAKRAGMQVIGLATTLPQQFLHDADQVVESFEELRSVLKSKLRIHL